MRHPLKPITSFLKPPLFHAWFNAVFRRTAREFLVTALVSLKSNPSVSSFFVSLCLGKSWPSRSPFCTITSFVCSGDLECCCCCCCCYSNWATIIASQLSDSRRSFSWCVVDHRHMIRYCNNRRWNRPSLRSLSGRNRSLSGSIGCKLGGFAWTLEGSWIEAWSLQAKFVVSSTDAAHATEVIISMDDFEIREQSRKFP